MLPAHQVTLCTGLLLAAILSASAFSTLPVFDTVAPYIPEAYYGAVPIETVAEATYVVDETAATVDEGPADVRKYVSNSGVEAIDMALGQFTEMIMYGVKFWQHIYEAYYLENMRIMANTIAAFVPLFK